ncbi:CAP domain-containing protein [Solirubrobacter ginsenosidimutans]|uniref:CAP domain-containing protein n=1 Tax=Solirubrobacter ginsenosidimutans TaxID=490573 RepID=A0A9X3MWK3_9ACTN|nr:CAP domain-containing protein [Solirubrobacter ginsenosidimutans]MDA0162575.1 CAP domain-containing protein [Solirubrobacter ginsenosidimutans]
MLTPAFTRTRLHAAAFALLAFGLFAAPASASRGVYQCAGSLDIPQTDGQPATAATAITCLVNVERTSRGIPALKPDADLAQAAGGHAADMSRRRFFAHVNTSGEGLSARLRDAGYGNPGDGWYAAEDLGWGTGDRATPNAIVDAWLNSPHHRRILLSPTYEELGVGVAQGAPKPTMSGLPGATYTLDLGTIRVGGD